MEKVYKVIGREKTIRTVIVHNAGLLGEDLLMLMGYSLRVENHDDETYFTFVVESASDNYNWLQVMELLVANEYEEISE